MRFPILTLTVAIFAGCAPTHSTLKIGTPWNDVKPAARHHGYEIGDTSGFALASTLFDEPPGITLDLGNDDLLLIFPDQDQASVKSLAIYRKVSKPKIERDWLELSRFDLATGSSVPK